MAGCHCCGQEVQSVSAIRATGRVPGRGEVPQDRSDELAVAWNCLSFVRPLQRHSNCLYRLHTDNLHNAAARPGLMIGSLAA